MRHLEHAVSLICWKRGIAYSRRGDVLPPVWRRSHHNTLRVTCNEWGRLHQIGMWYLRDV